MGLPEIEVRCLLGGTFEVPEWPEDPGCVYTCNNFPNVPKMKKVSNEPVLVGRALEYICKNSKKVPDTGERFFINCTEEGEGTFEGELDNFPGDDWPDLPSMDSSPDPRMARWSLWPQKYWSPLIW